MAKTTLTAAVKNTASELMKKHGRDKIYVNTRTGHMSFRPNAARQVKNPEEVVEFDGTNIKEAFPKAAETPAKETPKKEAPKEVPKKETPAKETPKKEAPKEAPKKEAPKEAPKKEAPKEAPKKEAPKQTPPTN